MPRKDNSRYRTLMKLFEIGKGDETSISKLQVEDLETIKPETTFIDDLGADSLDIVELIMALEEEFDMEIPEEEAEKITSVGDVVKYIEENK